MLEQIQTALSNTEQLAVWGAITGSIGTITGALSLYLRFRQQKRDQAKLKCEAVIEQEIQNNGSNIRYHIVVRSMGRRPVTVDYVQYRQGTLDFPRRLLRWYKWQNNEWLHKVEPTNVISLTEGTKAKIPVDPKRVGLAYVYSVKVVDQTGRSWSVKWPSFKELARLTHYKELHQEKEENPTREYSLHGYEAQDKFGLTLRWNPEDGKKNASTGRTFTFRSRAEYLRKMNDLTEVQIPIFMDGGTPNFLE